MSEYITFETEPTDHPDVIEIITNQMLTDADEEEIYRDPGESDEGSPIAQMLFEGIDGIRALTIAGDTLIITRDPDVPWEAIIDEVRDALRDFFL
jgi:hypothetical protein